MSVVVVVISASCEGYGVRSFFAKVVFSQCTCTCTCTCTFYLSVNVFSTKVLIRDTIFTSPSGDGTAILRGHPSHAKV